MIALIFKLLFITLLVFIFFSLGSAFYFLLKDRGQSNRTVQALSWRIGLSFILLLLIALAFFTGLIQPHAI